MAAETGLISLKNKGLFYTLYVPDQGWVALELLQFLDGVVEAVDRKAAILRLLGFTLQISTDSPRRSATHWAIVDLAERVLETNSDMIRRAVDRKPPAAGSPFASASLARLYKTLDMLDFTVKIYR